MRVHILHSQQQRQHATFRTRNFAIEYLCENEKVTETVSAFSYGAQVESFKQKMVENLVTLSL